jgi:hypothetical protein
MMGWGSTCTSALRYKQLLVCSDSMKRDTVTSNSVDDEKVCPEMTLGKASPIGTAFAEAVLSKCLRQLRPEISMSKTYSSVSPSNSGCLRAVR